MNMSEALAPVSLVAAFLAGMVALFAPCCITFLLPSYLGSVFKEKKQILFMTLVFGAGIFVTLLPAVLGVSLITKMLFRYHNLAYYAGGSVMILTGFITLYGIKLPMPSFSRQTEMKERPDILSIFTLGIFSGIASACCAPVLVGILSFTMLTPSLGLALLTGAMYVLGMVTPLLISGYFIDKGKVMNRAVWNRQVGPFRLNNLVSALIFIPLGILTLYLTVTGKLSMDSTRHYSQFIQNFAAHVDVFFTSFWNGIF